jgi:16S rRNA (adenine1518-N6/adenine1519-N6)-dimethyltransferase
MLKKKSLGQHFLHSAAYVRAVADAGNIAPGDTVLEIGPGEGVLTRELLNQGAHVIAIEKDARLIPVLAEAFAAEIAAGSMRVIEGDALEIDPGVLKLSQHYKIVANIPYYITGALLRKYLEGDHQPTTLVYLIQKEVAERVARSTKESILSLSIKAFGTPKYVKTVPKGAFVPPPTVDSAILQISDISRAHFPNKGAEQRFFDLLHAGFGQKRKLLRRNIEKVLGENCSIYMQEAGIPQDARAEDVPLEAWVRLATI